MGRVVKENGQIVKGDNRVKPVTVSGKGDKAIYGDAIKYKFKSPSEDPSRCPYAINKAQGVLDLVKAHPNWCKNGRNKLAYDDLIWADIKFYQPRLSSVITSLFSSVSGVLDIADAFNNGETGFDPINGSGLDVENPYANTILAHDTQWSLRIPLLKRLPEVRNSQFGNGEDGKLGGGFSNLASDFKSFITNNAGSSGPFGISAGKTLGIGSVLGNASGILSDVGKILFPSINSRDEDNYFRHQSLNSFELSFELLNSISPEETKWNNSLLHILTLLCSSSDRNKFISDSPVVAEIDLQTRLAPLCSVNFEFESVGSYLMVDGKPTPEAYQCKLSIDEKIPSTRGLELAYLSGKPIESMRAINTDPDALCSIIKRIGNTANAVGTKG